jgi:DNA-binding PadR family transcriptional regulator
MKIKEREIKLLKYIGKNIVCPAEAIQYKEFPKSSFYRWLDDLQENQWIQSIPIKYEKLYSLTKKGHQVLINEKESIPFFSVDAVKLSELNHHLTSVRCAKRFQESTQYQVISLAETYDRFLNNRHAIETGGYFRIPDFMLLKNGKRFCVEVELHIKSKSRYMDIFQFYERTSECDHIYWICKDQGVLDRLRDFFISTIDPLRHIFFLLDEFYESGINVTAYTHDGMGRINSI